MAVQTKGFCKYCGKEYTKSGILRHLPACRKRKIRLLAENDKRICRYFEIVVSDKYQKEYWEYSEKIYAYEKKHMQELVEKSTKAVEDAVDKINEKYIFDDLGIKRRRRRISAENDRTVMQSDKTSIPQSR